MGKIKNVVLTMGLAALAIAFAYFAYKGQQMNIQGRPMSTDIIFLPYYAARSFLRMMAAYIFSLIFSIAYGYKAATDSKAERILIPVLDILQSVPILGFFPAAVFFFVSLFNGHTIGVELASVFLIFTSQAWNMAFGYYESLTTIPKDIYEASEAFKLTGWLRFKHLFLPSGISKLVYNSILSWAGGWYFLIAAEIIAIGPIEYSLPGLGSFLIKTMEKGEIFKTASGLIMLLAIIALMNIFLWQPLTLWADIYKYEYGGAKQEDHKKGLGYWIWWQAPLFPLIRQWISEKGFYLIEAVGRFVFDGIEKALSSSRFARIFKACRSIISWAFRILFLYILGRSVAALIAIFAVPLDPMVFEIPRALLYSFVRLAAAYVISLLWTLPAALWIGHDERAEAFFMPVFQILASVPATALFPVMVYALIKHTGGMELAAVLLVLTGMQWYLLFNLISGVKSIPQDLKEAARILNLNGFLYWRRVALPALMPSLITGSITAWGGGWNALIVAEYVSYAGRIYKTFGIGSLLDGATYGAGNFQLIWSSLIAMMITIVGVNRFFWRKLYSIAAYRFKIES
ncbi:MAG: ABC transporter permease subunit [Tepidanaerobacteraceae bacterium]|jgi:NitT/TauT family transport system permease protein|nr:ABC transporter permease subunit [Tepidanaerobacteraceae bacterium]